MQRPAHLDERQVDKDRSHDATSSSVVRPVMLEEQLLERYGRRAATRSRTSPRRRAASSRAAASPCGIGPATTGRLRLDDEAGRAAARARRRRGRPARRAATARPRPASTSSTRPFEHERPRSRIATRSQVCSISASRWLDTNTVRPSAAELRAAARGSRGCRPGRGRWPVRRARAAPDPSATPPPRPSRCRMPSEYLRTLSSAAVGETDAARARRRPARRPMRSMRAEQPEVLATRHRREQRRRLDDRADCADHLASRRASAAEQARSGPRSAARARAGSGSSSSCPSRSVRGSRTRRLRAPRGRGRRPRPSSSPRAGGTPCGAPRSRSRCSCGYQPPLIFPEDRSPNNDERRLPACNRLASFS